MSHQTITGLLLAGTVAFSAIANLHAQGLSVDVSAGRLVHDPVSASVGANNLIGSVRYDRPRGAWIYGAVATPLADGATVWGAAGSGGRVMAPGSSRRRATVGADIGAHGFSFRDPVVDQVGFGGTLEAIPFARVSAGLGFVEGRGGWRGHALSFADGHERRGVFETGARAGYGAALRVEGDARWVHAAEGTYPFVGATVMYDGASVQAWAHTGKWLRDELDQATWGGGFAVPLGARSSVWADVRQEAPDPLYWNSTRRTWSVGITQRLGRIAAPIRQAPRSQTGAVVVTVRVADAPAGEVSIAGDFNNWQPAPMQREGNAWVVRLQLAPGAYHYAFRSATGEWFVPSSTPGRRDDGMGGHVAVLMVG
jgi:hypothetical protein